MKTITARHIFDSGKRGIVALSVSALTLFTLGATAPRVQAADKPADWSVTNHQGKQVNSSAFAGKVTIVNFWATWCIPCIVEIPTLHDLAAKYEKQGVSVIGVSVDANSRAMLQAFVDKFKMNYTVAMPNAAMMNNFRVSDTVPMTFVIDQNGKIFRRHVGYVKKEQLEKDVRALLKI
jgi:thiol-disulfide isomerase/thioredoxin